MSGRMQVPSPKSSLEGRSQEVRRPDERLAIDEAQARLVVGGAK